MGRVEGEVRVFGATAAEVLVACVSGAEAVSIDSHLVLGHTDRRGLVIHYLQTRSDGVVVLVADGGTPSFSAPPSWVVCQSTSCSKGIDYESVTVRRGDEPLLSVSEDPDGNLQVTRAGRVVESIPQEWTQQGEPIPRATPTTFRALADKWLAAIANELGDAAVVLSPDRHPAPPRDAAQAEATLPDGDEIPF